MLDTTCITDRQHRALSRPSFDSCEAKSKHVSTTACKTAVSPARREGTRTAARVKCSAVA